MTRETGMATKADIARRKRFENPKCKNCWDKGYSTVLTGGHFIAADFGGKGMTMAAREFKNYCSKCLKGKRLKRQANNGASNKRNPTQSARKSRGSG